MNKTMCKLVGCKSRLQKEHKRLFEDFATQDDGYCNWAERQFESLMWNIEEQVIALNAQLGVDAKADAIDWLRVEWFTFFIWHVA